ncbi:MAG: DUF1257 domain-containing protein [Phycisphaerales bacterium]|nr:MAG: DUF1257 domain-containing protein [Phycisphaerales bacterium]
MSTVLVLVPIVSGGWPLITAAVAGAASALGLVVKETAKQEIEDANQEQLQQVQVELAESEILAQSMVTGQEIVLVKGDIELRVRRDERGRCVVCAAGKGHSEAELKQMVDQFTQKLTQCFVYNRVATELKTKGFQVVDEEVMQDESIRINVRRYVE